MGHPANEVVANLHHPALNQHCAHRPLAPADLALDDDSPGKSLRSRFQFKDFRLKLNHFQQFIDAVTPGGGDIDKDGASSQIFRDQFMLQEGLLDLVDICLRPVDFIDGDDDWNIGRLGMIDRFNGLRLHIIICCNDKNHDIGAMRSASTHVGEGFVTRSV